jgi:50S ribosomal protein L16 3-hydroxylase
MSFRPLTRLGGLGVSRFMREYWQRKPLVIRNALPGLAAPVDRERLFALAAREEVESRLVERRGRRWLLREGPFAKGALPDRTRKHWTLLVQGVDLVDAAAHALLSRFRFLPDARLDDLMVSYATEGGGVGPHVDSYDVFLLQAAGHRRWRISAQRNLAPLAGQPLRMVAGFRATREWVLGPGDLLYLPPGIPHDGVAADECITCSIGFRAPSWEELLDPWFAHFAGRVSVPGRYADPGQRAVRDPARLPPAMTRRVHAALSARRPSVADTERFLLEHLSEPKAHVVFHRASMAGDGVALDRRSRMLIGRRGIGFNGEFVALGGRALALASRLARERELGPREIRSGGKELAARLNEWLAAGWLHPLAGTSRTTRGSARSGRARSSAARGRGSRRGR